MTRPFRTRIGSRAVAAATLAAATTLALAACDGNDVDQAAPSSTPTSAPSSAAPSTTPTQESSQAPAAGQAQPGQTFAFGQMATFAYTYGHSKGVIGVTVNKIEKGSPADLSKIKVSGSSLAGLTPYYIHYTIKNVGNTDLSYISVGEMTGLLANGDRGQDLSIIGGFGPCDSGSAPHGFTNGKTFTTCEPVLAGGGQAVTQAQYWGDPFDLDKGLVWK